MKFVFIKHIFITEIFQMNYLMIFILRTQLDLSVGLHLNFRHEKFPIVLTQYLQIYSIISLDNIEINN